MNLPRKMGLTLACQMIGVAAVAVANVIVAHRYGPTGQGYLSHYRSTVMLVAMVGAFGLPQALIYMINQATATRRWTVQFSSYYGIVFGAVCLIIFTIGLRAGQHDLVGFGTLAAVAIVFAATGTLLHDLYRAISLASRNALTFNLITIMPPVLACVIFACWSPASHERLVWVPFIAVTVSAVVAALVLERNPLATNALDYHESVKRFRFSFTFGFWNLLPGLLFNLLAVLTYTVLRQGLGGDAAAGQFSIAVLALTFAVMPLERVMPLLFDFWSKQADWENRRQSFVMLAHLGSVASLVVAAGGWLLARPVILAVFGPAFEPAVLPSQVFVFAGYAFYQSRLLASLLVATGHPRAASAAAVVRGGVLAVVMIATGASDVLTAVLAWTFGEVFAVAFLAYCVHRHTGWSFSEIHGVSPRWLTRLPAVIAGNPS